MACRGCLERWLAREPSCPHCRAALRPEQLVNCRWMTEVAQFLPETAPEAAASDGGGGAIDDDDGGAGDVCGEHGVPHTAYCATCRACVCHKCALWGAAHSGHRFEDLDDVHATLVTELGKHLVALTARRAALLALLRRVERNAAQLHEAHDTLRARFAAMAQAGMAVLGAQLRTKLATVLQRKNTLAAEARRLEAALAGVEARVRGRARAQLVDHFAEVAHTLASLHAQPLGDLAAEEVAADFTTSVVAARGTLV